MKNLKLSTAATAILMASAFPAFAQEADAMDTEVMEIEIPEGTVVPPEHILLQFADRMDDGFFVVSYDDAAEICGITEAEFALIADNPSTGVIYCEELREAAVRDEFIEEGRIVPLTNFEDEDDDDDDGNTGDDAEETAVDEAIDEANDDDNNLDDALQDDDVEAPEDDNDGGPDSDSAEEEDVTDQDGTTDGATTEGGN